MSVSRVRLVKAALDGRNARSHKPRQVQGVGNMEGVRRQPDCLKETMAAPATVAGELLSFHNVTEALFFLGFWEDG